VKEGFGQPELRPVDIELVQVMLGNQGRSVRLGDVENVDVG
jgi:hypothetical protein